jgi:xanthine/uracil/vitamin C permease (AzgA family)
LSASMISVVFSLFFIDLFDSAGTLTSIATDSMQLTVRNRRDGPCLGGPRKLR